MPRSDFHGETIMDTYELLRIVRRVTGRPVYLVIVLGGPTSTEYQHHTK